MEFSQFLSGASKVSIKIRAVNLEDHNPQRAANGLMRLSLPWQVPLSDFKSNATFFTPNQFDMLPVIAHFIFSFTDSAKSYNQSHCFYF